MKNRKGLKWIAILITVFLLLGVTSVGFADDQQNQAVDQQDQDTVVEVNEGSAAECPTPSTSSIDVTKINVCTCRAYDGTCNVSIDYDKVAVGIDPEDDVRIIAMVENKNVELNTDGSYGSVMDFYKAKPIQFILEGENADKYTIPEHNLTCRIYPHKIAAITWTADWDKYFQIVPTGEPVSPTPAICDSFISQVGDDVRIAAHTTFASEAFNNIPFIDILNGNVLNIETAMAFYITEAVEWKEGGYYEIPTIILGNDAINYAFFDAGEVSGLSEGTGTANLMGIVSEGFAQWFQVKKTGAGAGGAGGKGNVKTGFSDTDVGSLLALSGVLVLMAACVVIVSKRANSKR